MVACKLKDGEGSKRSWERNTITEISATANAAKNKLVETLNITRVSVWIWEGTTLAHHKFYKNRLVNSQSTMEVKHKSDKSKDNTRRSDTLSMMLRHKKFPEHQQLPVAGRDGSESIEAALRSYFRCVEGRFPRTVAINSTRCRLLQHEDVQSIQQYAEYSWINARLTSVRGNSAQLIKGQQHCNGLKHADCSCMPL